MLSADLSCSANREPAAAGTGAELTGRRLLGIYHDGQRQIFASRASSHTSVTSHMANWSLRPACIVACFIFISSSLQSRSRRGLPALHCERSFSIHFWCLLLVVDVQDSFLSSLWCSSITLFLVFVCVWCVLYCHAAVINPSTVELDNRALTFVRKKLF